MAERPPRIITVGGDRFERPYAEALSAFLNGAHADPRKGVAREIERVTGQAISTETIKSWLARRSFPTSERHLRALLLTYGVHLVLSVFGRDLAIAEQRIDAESAARAAALDASLQPDHLAVVEPMADGLEQFEEA